MLWSDDLLHSDEQIFEEIYSELPLTKRGNRIRRVIEKEFKLQRNYYFYNGKAWDSKERWKQNYEPVISYQKKLSNQIKIIIFGWTDYDQLF